MDKSKTLSTLGPDRNAAFRFARPDTYWVTRFVILRWMGFVYLVAFYVAARQLVPLVGSHGLTPAQPILYRLGHPLDGFLNYPSLFWINCSDAALHMVPWIGVALSVIVLAGYANAVLMSVLWIFYTSIVFVGLEWYGYGWEIQMSETGFLCIFLCPLWDARPFSLRPPPLPVIFLFRWLIVRIMLGSALIKWRGDSCWTDLTALYYHFETQPIPNPFSRWFHFLPHPVLQFGVIWTFVVEGVAPLFAFGPRWGRHLAGAIIISFQLTLMVSGNLSFFNWLTILPALACFDDRFWCKSVPNYVKSCAVEARMAARPSRSMTITSWCAFALIAVLSLYPHHVPVQIGSQQTQVEYTSPVINLIDPPEQQAMNMNFDPLHLVNTYGAFGSVGRKRAVLIFEATDDADVETATDWKEYPYLAGPWDPARAPGFIAPYQPHLDWQLWFAAMGSPDDYPWVWNLIEKMLHNDPATLGLFGGNPFPDHPPRYIRTVLYIYHFAEPDNPDHVYWTRERLGLWLPAYSVDSPELLDELRAHGWGDLPSRQ